MKSSQGVEHSSLVWTFVDGKHTRMEMYSHVGEA